MKLLLFGNVCVGGETWEAASAASRSVFPGSARNAGVRYLICFLKSRRQPLRSGKRPIGGSAILGMEFILPPVLGGETLVNVRHLAELAGILSAQALAIVESPRLGNADSFARLEDVFIRRSEAWHSRLHWLRSGSHFWFALSDEDPRSRLIEEILVSEVLSRVTAGLLAAYGQQHGDRPACRFAADLFNQHQLARRSALIEMLAMADAELPEVRRLDRLRRLAERWTDILLGPLSCRFAIRPLVFEFSRSKEYGQSMLPFLTSPAGLGVFAVGLKSAFPESVVGVPSHAGYHRDTAAAVLGLLPHDLFENPGGLMPLRTVRSLRSAHVPKASPVRAPEDVSPASKLAFSQIRRRPERP